jgi:membrane fusion protein (multidrug efflux system)
VKFTAFPPQNASGNLVKIVQPVPVKIHIHSGLDPPVPVPLSLSVIPTVHLIECKRRLCATFG